VGHLVNILFNPPEMPDIELPMAAHLIPHVKMAIAQAFELAYYRGVYDGLVAGVLLTLLFVPVIKERLGKGANNVISNI
jgi:hypothetical protein